MGLIPQVLLNFKLRSARGINDVTLLGYFNGFLSFVYYAYCCNLPFSYKVMLPLSFITFFIIVVQRFVYERPLGEKSSFLSNGKLLVIYVLNGLLYVLIIPGAVAYPMLIGNVAGWISISIWALYQVPQVFKIYYSKSIVGFSFLLVSLVGFGDCLQLLVAIILKFPAQMVVNGFRGVLIYLIFCLQFLRYCKR